MPNAATFYRIVLAPKATVDDFVSDAAAGEPPPIGADQQTLRMWQGISVYATEAQARNKARAIPVLGGYLAELAVPNDGRMTYEKTGGRRNRGHHTLWGEPEEILRCVIRVVRV